ncbi:uncharacterized protein C8Q71DRAFT_758110 [Rhodofomes roseus]|uniref:HNH endonuclease n=1 Tax=Rhodofomes roseus TaxID=34475 RepID=A0ABQ8KGD2_9APHY|nr:uncharacterized protein C8Q71DRAFT_758110 [Rhodofomes roseus]KAH9836477.1 hypothetical protein C8Q71DRAFT_758110 [Rhodofomes roseus]
MSSNWRFIIVNGWKFCQEHGQEQCDRCRCDYRLENNHTAALHEILDELLLDRDFDLNMRMSRHAYNRGAIPVKPGSNECKCRTHNSKGCWVCYDWVEIVRREVTLLRPQTGRL